MNPKLLEIVAEETGKMDGSTVGLIITTAGAVLVALFSTLTGARKKTVEDMQTVINDLRKNYDALSETVEILKNDNTRLSCENASLRERLTALEADGLVTKRKIIDLQHENDDLKKEVLRLSQDNGRLKIENTALQSRIQQLENQQAGE